VSWQEVIAAFERALGRALPVRHVAPGEPVPTVPPPAWPLFAAFETFDSPIDMTETARTYGVTPTTLDAYVRRTCRPAPAGAPPRELVGSAT
jgi:hypothetical protein